MKATKKILILILVPLFIQSCKIVWEIPPPYNYDHLVNVRLGSSFEDFLYQFPYYQNTNLTYFEANDEELGFAVIRMRSYWLVRGRVIDDDEIYFHNFFLIYRENSLIYMGELYEMLASNDQYLVNLGEKLYLIQEGIQ